jgi:hypothetical protein
VIISDVFPHLRGGARVLIGAVIPDTHDVMGNMDSQNVCVDGLQVVELSLAPGPLALEDLVLSGRAIVNLHLDLNIFVRRSAGPLLDGSHCLWRGWNDNLGLA